MRNEASVARSSSRLSRMVVGLSLAATMLAGCGDSSGLGNVQVHPVKGKVLLKDDKPLTTGRIVFTHPKLGFFSSSIGADGTFAMTSQKGDGIPEGDYVVHVEPEAPTSLGPAGKKPSSKGGWAHPYPESYSDETTSTLKATVKPGDNNLEPFKLVPNAAEGRSKSGKKAGRDD